MNPTFIKHTFVISLPESPIDGEIVQAVGRTEDEAFDRALCVAQRMSPFAALSRVDSDPSTSVAYAAQEAQEVAHRLRKAAKAAIVSQADNMLGRLGLAEASS